MKKNQYAERNHTWISLDERVVVKMYCVDGFSTSHIAKHFSVTRSVIRLRLRRNNIPLRSFSEQHKTDKSFGRNYNYGVSCGNKNGQYKHGKFVGDKKNRREYLEAVKDRVKVCEHCGATQTNDNFSLVVHHKDGNNRNKSQDNLNIFCQSCHTKEHFRNGSMRGRPCKK